LSWFSQARRSQFHPRLTQFGKVHQGFHVPPVDGPFNRIAEFVDGRAAAP